MLGLATACSALAQTAAPVQPVDCSSSSARVSDLSRVAGEQSLQDLSIRLDAGQAGKLSRAYVYLYEGTCAGDIEAVRMTQIAFRDGAIFGERSGKLAYQPEQRVLTNAWNRPMPAGAPVMDGAAFVMASHVDGGYGAPSLEVGLWKAADGYVVAAYIRRDTGFSAPIELLRSGQPTRSVTFFPAPDVNAGNLYLLIDTGQGVAQVALLWDHAAISRLLRDRQ